MGRVTQGAMYVVAAVLLLALLGACGKTEAGPVATIAGDAECPSVKAHVVQSDAGTFYVLDAKNLDALLAVMKGLQAGKCKVERIGVLPKRVQG